MDIKALIQKISLPKLNGVQKKIRPAPRMVLVVLLLLVIFADVWALQGVFRTLYNSHFADVGAKPAKSTRVNFESYNKALDRVHTGAEYSPPSEPTQNPFQVVQKKVPPK